jgi:hypothetical protein
MRMKTVGVKPRDIKRLQVGHGDPADQAGNHQKRQQETGKIDHGRLNPPSRGVRPITMECSGRDIRALIETIPRRTPAATDSLEAALADRPGGKHACFAAAFSG